jgi:hypothetical protein
MYSINHGSKEFIMSVQVDIVENATLQHYTMKQKYVLCVRF